MLKNNFKWFAAFKNMKLLQKKSYIKISLTHSAYLLDLSNNKKKLEKKINCKSKHFRVKKKKKLLFLQTKPHFVQYVVKHNINQNDPNQKSYRRKHLNKQKEKTNFLKEKKNVCVKHNVFRCKKWDSSVLFPHNLTLIEILS